MIRRLAAGATVVIVSMGFVVMEGGSAVAKVPAAKGIANCPIYSGSGTLHPALQSGLPGGVKIVFNATLTSPTGGPCGNASVTSPAGVTVDGGTVSGSGSYSPLSGGALATDCSNFHGVDVVKKIKVKIVWLTTPPSAIAPTVITYTNNPATVSGAPTDDITLNAPPGTATSTGSFSSGVNHLTKLITNIPAACAASVSSFNITGGNVLVQ